MIGLSHWEYASYTPTHYTVNEGGTWRKLQECTVKEDELNELKGKANILNRVPVKLHMWAGVIILNIHSLAFHNPIDIPTGGFARWDCLNGWTTPIKDVEGETE